MSSKFYIILTLPSGVIKKHYNFSLLSLAHHTIYSVCLGIERPNSKHKFAKLHAQFF